MTNRSTIIRGEAKLKPCVKHAASLMYDVYDIESAGRHIAPAAQKAIDETKKHYPWPGVETTGTKESKEEGVGYHARFYEPLNQDDPRAGCPPVLMFRGSEAEKEDFRELNIALDIVLSNVRFTGKGALDVVSPVFETIDKALKWLKEYSPDQRWNPIDTNDVASLLDAILPDSTNFSTIDLSQIIPLKGNQKNEELSGKLNIFSATGHHEFALTLGQSLTALLLPLHLGFDWRLSASLHYGPNGDWGANVTQATGFVGKQYELAMADALEYAKVAKDKYKGRLIIMGHSLGGGLASAAAAVAKHKNPGMTIISRTFNASGLHKNTPRGYKASVNEGSTQCRSVEDEILTTLQSHPEKIPLLQPFLEWAKSDESGSYQGIPFSFDGLATAKVSLSERCGISPEKNLDDKIFPPVWGNLSKLFPIDEQTMGEDLSRYGSAKPIYERTQLGVDSSGNPYYSLPVPGEAEHSRVSRRSQAFDNNFETILILDKWAAELTPDKFIQRIAGWLLTGSKNAENGSYLNLVSMNTINIFSRKNKLMAEADDAAKLVLASADYHLVDMCLFTYILDKETHG